MYEAIRKITIGHKNSFGRDSLVHFFHLSSAVHDSKDIICVTSSTFRAWLML